MPAPRIEDEGLAPHSAHASTPWSARVPFRNSNRKGLTIAGAVVAAGLIGFALSAPGAHSNTAPAAPPPPAVSAAAVLAKSVTYWDEFPGRVTAIDNVEIRPRVGGYIESIKFREGDEVKKGDVLFVIDRRPFQAQASRAEAELVRARTQSDLAKTQADRAQKLLDGRVISQEEFDQRIAAYAEASAAVRAAEAAAQSARLDLEFTEVRSPIDGRAGQALITAGNLVNPNQSLLTTVVSLDKVYVYFESDEQTFLRYAEMGQRGERSASQDARHPVHVALADEKDFPHQGYLDFVDNHLDPTTGTIRARAVLENKDRSLTPGLFARVKLLGSGQVDALLVDEKAILTDQDRKYVYVVGDQNRAVRRDITLGRESEGFRVVTSGLTPTDRVIVHGVQKIFMPGMPVNPTDIQMGEPPAQAANLAGPQAGN
ncbi:MAG: efflux RND transporter periplasmic adaptor subunit [Rhodospirillaceae bacterium]